MVAPGYYYEQYITCGFTSVLVLITGLQVLVLLKTTNKDIGAVKRLGIPMTFMAAVFVLVRSVDQQAVFFYPWALPQLLGLFVIPGLIVAWLHTFLYSFLYAQYLIARHRVPRFLRVRLVTTCTFCVIALAIGTTLFVILDQQIWRSLANDVLSVTLVILALVTVRAVQWLKTTIVSGGITSPEVDGQIRHITRVQAFCTVVCISIATYLIYTGVPTKSFQPETRADPEKYQLKAVPIMHAIALIVGIPISWLPLRRLWSDDTNKSTRDSGSQPSKPSLRSPSAASTKRGSQDKDKDANGTAGQVTSPSSAGHVTLSLPAASDATESDSKAPPVELQQQPQQQEQQQQIELESSELDSARQQQPQSPVETDPIANTV